MGGDGKDIAMVDGSEDDYVESVEKEMVTTAHSLSNILSDAPLDVNRDGSIDEADIVPIVDHLNGESMVDLASLDVNHDGMVSPMDALLIINHLNKRADLESDRPDAEGSGIADSVAHVATTPNGASESVGPQDIHGYPLVETPVTESITKRESLAAAADEYFYNY